MFNICIKHAITHDAIDIIISFNQRKLFIVYINIFDDARKQFFNISGCNSCKYHFHDRTGINGFFQTGYIRKISYTLKPTGL